MSEEQDLSTYFPYIKHPISEEQCGTSRLFTQEELRDMYNEGPFVSYTGTKCTPIEQGLLVWRVNVSPQFFWVMLGDTYHIGQQDQMNQDIPPTFTVRGILLHSESSTYHLLVEINSCVFTLDPVHDYWGTEFLYEVYWNNGPY